MDHRIVDAKYYYDGDDLGVTYSKEKSTFKLWAPLAKNVQLILCDDIFPMKCGPRGVWETTLENDFHGLFYNYNISLDGEKYKEVVDPYAKSLSVNGKKGAIIDFEEATPDHWSLEKPSFENPVDAIIYELHIRDISIDESSGIKHKGNYLGLSETDTVTPDGLTSGLNHIKELGVTHVQLMPIYDFATVDETNEDDYNWGYDPLNFNALDGSYSTDPYDPTARIYEFKQMVQSIHDSGIRVIMDVVYNHVYDIHSINFEDILPGYYFRKKDNGEFYNGSGCGNEVASERKMVRKFIVDSVVNWATEYNLDGFRFDLMGLIDIETMNQIRYALDKIDPSIIMIGEGWEMGEALEFKDKACLWNSRYLPRIGQFNDDFRDGIRGDNFNAESIGYIGGDYSKKLSVLRGVVGGIEYSDHIKHLDGVEANQTVNYVEVHDNHTLFDKLKLSVKDQCIKERHLLGTAIAILSQGITLIHSGQEIMRTKDFEHNTYNMGDEVNKFDWHRKKEYLDVFKYVKALIQIKKEHPSFRLTHKEEIRSQLNILETDESTIAYRIKNPKDSWHENLIIHNVSKEKKRIKLKEDKTWHLVIQGKDIDLEGEKKISGQSIEIEKLSTTIAYSLE